MKKLSLIVLLAMLVTQVSFSQDNPSPYGILFKSMSVVPEKNAADFFSKPDFPAGDAYQGRFYRIIQFERIPSQDEKEIMRNAGVTLLDYLPQMAWFAAFSIDYNRDVMKTMPVRSVIEISSDFKLDLPLYRGNYPPYAMAGNDRIRLTVCYFPDLEPDAVIASLTGKSVVITGREDFGKLVYTEAGIYEIAAIARLPFVMFIEPGAAPPQPENYTGRTLHHTNAIATDFPGGRHYDGAGVNAVLQDDGIIGPHIDYQGRIGAQFLTNNGGNHGDHCAGILMGGGNRDPRGRGNGSGATLWVYSVSPNYPGFTAIPTTYSSLGIRVTSASYGDGCNTGYTSLTRTLDQQVRLYPSLMHVFSAGNSGTDNCFYGAGPGWGNITGGHKQGKNVIAVANLDYQDVLASSSSRGPAFDGRIKPDVGSKGTSVYSTIDPNTYENNSGTSMACPAVAGTLTGLIQAFRTLNNGKDPMAGLLKATLLNTAEDLGNPGPDFKFGWGRINALRAVQLFEQSRYDSGVVSQGTAASHIITVPANTAQLRIMVYWTDYEASVNSTQALVNNLDITVTDPAAAIWHPWVLNHYPHPDSLNKVAVRGTDSKNNMEQVTLDYPAAGNYTLNVQGSLVPQGPQVYYVVYEFIPESVVLTYPAGGESLVPGQTETIRWDAFGATDPFTLEFSDNNGQSWDTIAANVQGNQRSYNWTVSNVITGSGLIRVGKSGSVSMNEAPFSIIGVPCNLTVDWACDTAMHFSWSGVGGATAYEVLRLGEKYMDSIGVTTLNSFIIKNPSSTESTWLSVRALGQGGAKGQRAVAIQKVPGNQNCQPVDAMMASAPTAQWGMFQSCMPLGAVGMQVVVRNFGLAPLENPTASYQFDNGAIVTEQFTGTIKPDSSAKFTFTQKIDLSATGPHLLKTWVTCPQDLNPSNDSITVPVEVVNGTIFPYEGVQDFESWTKCLSLPVCDAYSCDLADGWINLANPLYDAHDWRTFSGSTPSSLTGPDVDHTLGTNAGKYLYVEPSVNCLNKTALLAPPCIDLTNSISALVTLWYHAYGADINSFHVDIFDGDKITEDVVVPVSGTQENKWKKLEVDLTPWAGSIVALRLRATTGCRDKGDFAIDDFSIEQVLVSVDEKNLPATGALKIFPNPALREITVSLKEAGNERYQVLITDLFGRVYLSEAIAPKNGRIYETIRLPELAGGIYMVGLKSDHRDLRTKLVVK